MSETPLITNDATVLVATDLAVRCAREGAARVQATVATLEYRRPDDLP